MGLTKNGSGTVIINYQPTYTGTIMVQEGSLSFSQDALGPSGDTVVNGGKLYFSHNFNGAGTISIGRLELNSGDI